MRALYLRHDTYLGDRVCTTLALAVILRTALDSHVEEDVLSELDDLFRSLHQ
jgi:hypothetical protein